MAYSVNVLTANGKAVIAGASASNRLIYTRMLTSSDAMAAEDATAASVSDFEGPQGPIVAASATDSVARVVGVVRNTSAGADPVELRSFALCGRLESAAQDAVLLVLSDPAASVILPSASAPVSGSSVGFSLRIDAGVAAMVTITSAGSATISDLERMVSCHRAGDATTGDAQSVLGTKIFEDGVGASVLEVEKDDAKGWSGDAAIGGDLLVSGSERIVNNLEIEGSVMTSLVEQIGSNGINIIGDVNFTGNLNPDESDLYCIGQSDNWFLDSYVRNCFAENIIPLRSETAINVNGSILPDTDDSRSLGGELKRYEYIYGRFLYTEAVGYVDSSVNVKFYDNHPTYNYSVVVACSNAELSIEATGTTVGCKFRLRMGSATPLKIEYSSSISSYVITLGVPVANLQTTGDATVNGILTVSGMTGTAPYYSSGRKVVVGSIIMAWKDAMTSDKYTGQTITQTDSSTVLYFCLMSTNGPVQSSTNRLPNGTYSLMCDCVTSACWVMVQCLSLD